jgi:hypothetical protein
MPRALALVGVVLGRPELFARDASSLARARGGEFMDVVLLILGLALFLLTWGLVRLCEMLV